MRPPALSPSRLVAELEAKDLRPPDAAPLAREAVPRHAIAPEASRSAEARANRPLVAPHLACRRATGHVARRGDQDVEVGVRVAEDDARRRGYRPRGRRKAGEGDKCSRGGDSHVVESRTSPAFGSRSRNFGRYQFHSPRSFIDAGSSTARTIVASISTAAASPTPASLMSSDESDPKSAKTATITSAALVTTPAVTVIPCRTASSVGIPASTDSRTRLRMNTW